MQCLPDELWALIFYFADCTRHILVVERPIRARLARRFLRASTPSVATVAQLLLEQELSSSLGSRRSAEPPIVFERAL